MTRRKWVAVVLVLGLLLSIACVTGALQLWFYLTVPPMVRNLPSSASGIQYFEDTNLFPDSSLIMKATLPEDACRDYVKVACRHMTRLGPQDDNEIGWVNVKPKPWWNPKPVDRHPTWYFKTRGLDQVAQCADGYLYYLSASN